MRLYKLNREFRPYLQAGSHVVNVFVKLKDKTEFWSDCVICYPEEIKGIFNEHKANIKKEIARHKRELG